MKRWLLSVVLVELIILPEYLWAMTVSVLC